jgi:hypothetical protein
VIVRLLLAVSAQAVAAFGNLAVTLLLARTLDTNDFAQFIIVYGWVIFGATIYSTFIGDFIAIRGIESSAQSAVRAWHYRLIAGAVVVVFAASLFSGIPALESLLASAFAFLWVCEEYGRRCLMTTHRFGAQAINDGVYSVVAILLIVAFSVAGIFNLLVVLVCVVIASFSAVLLAHFQLPRQYRLTAVSATSTASTRALVDFGSWRAAQAGAGALALVAGRTAILLISGAAVLQTLEIARVLAAPAAIALGGASNVILAALARNQREKGDSPLFTRVVTAIAVLGTSLYGALILLYIDPISALIVPNVEPPDQIAVSGWLAMNLVIALFQVTIARSAIELGQRPVFWLRSFGTVLGFSLVLALSANDLALLMPFALTVGLIVSGALIGLKLLRSTESPEG